MPQSKFEKGFWAACRGGKGNFTPYPPEHWRKPKTEKKRPRKAVRIKIAPEAPEISFLF